MGTCLSLRSSPRCFKLNARSARCVNIGWLSRGLSQTNPTMTGAPLNAPRVNTSRQSWFVISLRSAKPPSPSDLRKLPARSLPSRAGVLLYFKEPRRECGIESARPSLRLLPRAPVPPMAGGLALSSLRPPSWRPRLLQALAGVCIVDAIHDPSRLFLIPINEKAPPKRGLSRLGVG
jgi:hypothetical protein